MVACGSRLRLQRRKQKWPALPWVFDLSIAMNRLLAFVNGDPGDPGDLARRRDAIDEACRMQRWSLARALLRDGLQLHGDDAKLLALSGLVYLRTRDYAAAEQELRAAIARCPDDAEVRYRLALSIFFQGRHAQALEHLSTAVIAALPAALLVRARCLHRLDCSDQAIEDCRAYLSIAGAQPSDVELTADANGQLALLLFEQEDFRAAAEHVRTALKHNPTQLEALLTLASLQAEALEDHAARHTLDTLLQAHPECGQAWLTLSMVEISHQDLGSAKDAIVAAVKYLPEHIGTWHVLGWIELLCGDLGAARAAFEQALTIDCNFGESHGGLAVVAAWQGREQDAVTARRRALQLDPHSISARYAEMVLLQRAGKYREAQAVLASLMDRRVTGTELIYRDLVSARLRRLGFGEDDVSVVSYH
jgi:tetratricopeptide (TPR) repeat protein